MEGKLQCERTFLFFDSNDGSWIEIAFCVIQIIIAAIAMSENALVILSIWRTPSLHTPSNILVAGLAFSDFIIGLVVQPAFAATNIAAFIGAVDLYCSCVLARSVAGYCLGSITVSTLTVISLDKYMAIKLHLRYREIVTITRVIAVLVAIWLTNIALALSILWSDVVFVGDFVSASVVVNLLVAGFTYLIIFRVVRRHKAQIQVHVQQEVNGTTNRQNNRSSFSMFLISIIFVLCCLPFIVIRLLSRSKGPRKLSWYRPYMLSLSLLLVFVNSAINPVLYCWRFKEIRAAIVRTTKDIFRKNSK